MLISPLSNAIWKHKTQPTQPVSCLHLLCENRGFSDRFCTRAYSAKKCFFRFFRQNPPPVQVKNLPPIQKSCFQLVHTSVNPIKKVWMENLVATLRTTFLKMPTRHPACLYVGWRFSPKHQKSFDFRIPMRFLIQIFFIGPEIHYTLW